ncbi:MAG: hypothetical protein QOJ51_5225 [Acidobacteriaceae bacterium]|jgi:hypothetical protein|nr:hypothetical protein [Acidobacteriaceae bacterium]MEA2262400.1 hypothetical protein [Acidobacteriaceae bacterium]
MLSISFCNASWSRVDRGKERKRLILRSRIASVPQNAVNFLWRANGGSRTGYAPMGGHGLARPNWTDFRGSVIADGENEIQPRGTCFREFLPRLAAQTFSAEPSRVDLLKRFRSYKPGGMATGISLRLLQSFGAKAIRSVGWDISIDAATPLP